MGELVFFLIAFLEERECVEMLLMMQNELVSNLPFLIAINADKQHFSSPIITKAA